MYVRLSINTFPNLVPTCHKLFSILILDPILVFNTHINTYVSELENICIKKINFRLKKKTELFIISECIFKFPNNHSWQRKKVLINRQHIVQLQTHYL